MAWKRAIIKSVPYPAYKTFRLRGNRHETTFTEEFTGKNIWTFDSKGELLLTIMSSVAQEESRSISENVTWGQRKRFADGKVTVLFKRFLGYDRGEDGNLVINEGQARNCEADLRYVPAGAFPVCYCKGVVFCVGGSPMKNLEIEQFSD